jgi:D-lactate dehydrogenase
VLITGHQAFFTRQALENIASITLSNLSQLEKGEPCPNEITADVVLASQKKK